MIVMKKTKITKRNFKGTLLEFFEFEKMNKKK